MSVPVAGFSPSMRSMDFVSEDPGIVQVASAFLSEESEYAFTTIGAEMSSASLQKSFALIIGTGYSARDSPPAMSLAVRSGIVPARHSA